VLLAARPPPPRVPTWTPVAATITGVLYRACIRGIRVQLTPSPHAHRMEPEEAGFFSFGLVVHLHSAGFQGSWRGAV
jgi:hypothetical protein